MGYKDALLNTMLGCLLLAGIGCSESEPADPGILPDGQGYLSISGASVVESSAASAAGFTRADATTPHAPADDTLPEEVVLDKETDRIGVFLQADPDNGYKEPVNNKEYTYGVPIWTSEPHLMLDEKSAQLAAYYPYNSNGYAPTEVMLTSQAYAADREFYYQPFNASRISSSFHLKLRRAYSLVRFNVFAGEAGTDTDTGKGAYLGDGKVTAFTFTAPLTSIGTLNLFTGAVTVVNANVSFSVGSAFTAGTPATPYKLDYLIVPTDLSGLSEENAKVSFTLTVDGKLMQGSVTAAAFFGTDKRLVEGVKYEVNIVIRPTGLEVGTLLLQNWEEVNTTDQPLEIK